MKLSVIAKYYHTLKYLKPVQIYGRVFSIAKSKLKLSRLPVVPVRLNIKLSNRVPFIPHDPWNTKENILQGKFTFLNEEQSLVYLPDWHYQNAPLLWKFNLHYFNYLFLLEPKEQEDLCLHWIDNNPIGKGTGWNPYVTSLRIVNWCKSKSESGEIKKSIYAQASYLFRHLEIYFPGNHLLENAKALIIAGLYFEGQGEAKKWLTRGADILTKELPIQVLADGAYFELSPMYHAIMLEGFLDLVNVLPYSNTLRGRLIEVCGKMIRFQEAATHPNGNVALLNDSTEEIALNTSQLLQYAKKLIPGESKRVNSFPDAGYYTFRNNDIYLIADCGKIGPDYLPAHSHADIFNYELSIMGEKVITDSGVYEYASGEMRDYNRSTKAHNTVSVDGADQAEYWGGFRVARRYKPAVIDHKEEENFFYLEGKFEGYSHLIGNDIVHARKFELDAVKRELSIKDYINGSGIHNVKSYIHLAPEAEVICNGNEYRISLNDANFTVEIKDGESILEESWVSPQFGIKIQNKCITIIKKDKLPTLTHYIIRY